MGENTKIEWTDHTFNPWIGCTKVSPGCDHCYAERRLDTRLHRVRWGAGQPRQRTKTWGDPARWNKQHAAFYAEHGRRQRVFCASLADVFDNEVPPQWRVDLFRLIAATPNLDWLLLTKRIGNVAKMLGDYSTVPLLPNVWLGASIVNREEMLRDGPKLKAVPARVRFWSVEPMLGFLGEIPAELMPEWVICGGESGPGARPMHPAWVRNLRDQCADAGVPFLFKQWGEWAQAEAVPEDDERKLTERWLRRDGSEPAGEVDFFGGDEALYKVGKAHALRTLDGREHNGFPEPQHA